MNTYVMNSATGEGGGREGRRTKKAEWKKILSNMYQIGCDMLGCDNLGSADTMATIEFPSVHDSCVIPDQPYPSSKLQIGVYLDVPWYMPNPSNCLFITF